jgi:hypothetical protein
MAGLTETNKPCLMPSRPNEHGPIDIALAKTIGEIGVTGGIAFDDGVTVEARSPR